LLAVLSALAVASVAACQRRPAEPVPAAERQPQTTALLPGPAPAPSIAPALPFPVEPGPPPDPKRVRFAVIGDYGAAGSAERAVSELVKAYRPEIVLTLGDNNYPHGGADTIDANIGQFYASFIAPYRGKYGPGARENRFFPSLGNHDYYTDDAAPYLDYFTLPGNERYYTFSRGPVDFFALDSDPHEPDGVTATSVQAKWLRAQAAAARGAWQIAYMHHPPYSSGPHGPELHMQWPYREWGIDLVLAGHDHTYERIVVDGLTYLVNGLGGKHEYQFKDPVPGSAFRYNARHGAQLCEATATELRLSFVTVDGTRIEEVVLKK
jgi:tartrate-resistant acid phosphatase type 5